MINFIKDNRISLFVEVSAKIASSPVPISTDASPNGIFEGYPGTVLVKNGSDILYRENGDAGYTNLSSMFPYIIAPKKYILSQGPNLKATWIKNTEYADKTWVFIGFSTPSDGSCSGCYPIEYYS